MIIKWIKTAHKGLRYYEHKTRKHGKKKDRYYSVRFKVDGKDYTYGIGWWSDGIPEEARHIDPNMGVEEYCLSQLRLFKTNVRAGSGVKSPKEKRESAKAQEARKQAEEERREKEALTFGAFFNGTYLTQARVNKKAISVTREMGICKRWILPLLGHLPMKDVSPFHLEKLKQKMAAKELSPRSIGYALAVIRQVFNTAKRLELFDGENPTAKVKFPKSDSSRMRFLTHEEANAILESLKTKSIDVHDMTLLSLNCGLRFGEIASLMWQDVDLERGILTIRDAKAGSRYAYLTEQATEMLRTRHQGKPADYIFQGRTGKMDRISVTFARTVDELKLNEGITDLRLQICFHSCRHTYASWMIEQGQDLYTVQKLLGHKTNIMTQRYAHMAENKLKGAAMALSKALQDEKEQRQAGEVVEFKK